MVPSGRSRPQRPEAAARARVEELRQRIAELTESLECKEVVLSRLDITQETVTEILGESGTREPDRWSWRPGWEGLADRGADGAAAVVALFRGAAASNAGTNVG
ncbi:hypothetical protein OG604_47520 [Streptomyces sp. NBC_01231]|nr:hypothetical protein OG604_47520 [Streptomyces sp. NBC_01231]